MSRRRKGPRAPAAGLDLEFEKRGLLRPAHVIRRLNGVDELVLRKLMDEGHIPVEHFQHDGHRYRGIRVEVAEDIARRAAAMKPRSERRASVPNRLEGRS